jgi:hypothetical protein
MAGEARLDLPESQVWVGVPDPRQHGHSGAVWGASHD